MGCFCFRKKKNTSVNTEKTNKNEPQTPFNPPPPIRIPKHRISFTSISNIYDKQHKKHKKYKKKSHTR